MAVFWPRNLLGSGRDKAAGCSAKVSIKSYRRQIGSMHRLAYPTPVEPTIGRRERASVKRSVRSRDESVRNSNVRSLCQAVGVVDLCRVRFSQQGDRTKLAGAVALPLPLRLAPMSLRWRRAASQTRRKHR